MNNEQTPQIAQNPPCFIHSFGGSYFDSKYRIVTDKFNGFEVQIKRWWLPIWVQCHKLGSVNSFRSIDAAKEWVKKGRPKDDFKSFVVEYL
jgi:hypothetical protein